MTLEVVMKESSSNTNHWKILWEIILKDGTTRVDKVELNSKREFVILNKGQNVQYRSTWYL